MRTAKKIPGENPEVKVDVGVQVEVDDGHLLNLAFGFRKWITTRSFGWWESARGRVTE